MKTRSGFVANSSSSSFIIVMNLPFEKMKEILFGRKISLAGYKTRFLAEVIWLDLLKGKTIQNKRELAEELLKGSFDGMPKYPENPEDWGIWEVECKRVAKKIADRFMAEARQINPNSQIISIEYTDNGSRLGYILETKVPFKKLNCLIVDKH